MTGTFDPWSSGDKVLTFRPSSALMESTTYQIKVDASKATSAAGVPMSGNFISHFTTRQLRDIIAPTITCPPSTVNADQGIVIKIHDESNGWGIEWNFLRVKDNGVDATPCLVVNEIDGNVTVPPPNIVGEHTIEVSVEDMAGNKATSICSLQVTMPSDNNPTDLRSSDPPQVSCTAGDGRVTVTWTASLPSCCPGLKCVIYRGTSPSAMSSLAIVTGNAFDDNSVINGQEYYYQVRVVYELGEGPASLAIGAMPISQTSAPIPSEAIGADPIASVGVLILLVAGGFAVLTRRKRKP